MVFSKVLDDRIRSVGSCDRETDFGLHMRELSKNHQCTTMESTALSTDPLMQLFN